MEGMQKVLEEVRDLLQWTLTNESFNLLLSATITEWSQHLSIYLDPKKQPKKHYVAALVNLETYYSIPNIESANNSFVYSMDSGANWKTLTIPEGSYELLAFNGDSAADEGQRRLELCVERVLHHAWRQHINTPSFPRDNQPDLPG
jgi:hypothetical protein